MLIEQISIFIENKHGRLAEVTGVLGRAEVNIRALSLADTRDFGVLRLIVDSPDKALAALSQEGFTAKTTQVVAVEVPDNPGGLNRILSALDAAGVNVEYMYAFVGRYGAGGAIMIFRFDDLEKGIEALERRGFKLIPGATIYSL